MILRPVSPASPIGPPISKRPVGLTSSRSPEVSRPTCASTGSHDVLLDVGGEHASRETSAACWVETTTVSTATGVVPS